MFKYFEPNKIFSITSKAPKYVFILFIIVLSIGLVEALVLSPEDYKQSHSVRIMYVHVPAAWISLGIFSSITVLSISGFIFKNKNFFLISKSLAPSGFVFNISKKYGLEFTKMSLKFCEMQDFMTSVIIGATTMEQLKTNIESVNVNLSNDIIEEINQVQTIYPNPCP